VFPAKITLYPLCFLQTFFRSQVRRVLDVMRGRSFEDAIIMMEYMPYRACEEILRALKSVSDQRMLRRSELAEKQQCSVG
jgi:hypothetical protein